MPKPSSLIGLCARGEVATARRQPSRLAGWRSLGVRSAPEQGVSLGWRFAYDAF